jgi:hypothetical protein
MNKAEVLEALEVERSAAWAWFTQFADFQAYREHQAYFEGIAFLETGLEGEDAEPLIFWMKCLAREFLETKEDAYLHVLRLYETLDDVPLGVLD